MALTIDELRKLMDGTGLAYFLHPDNPLLLCMVTGEHGRYQFVVSLDTEGKFLQLRTHGLLQCLEEHAHIVPVLKALAAVNYQARFIKVGWDRKDGEIVAYGDTWIADGKLTQDQFKHIIGSFLPYMDVLYAGFKRIIETGEDVDPLNPADAVPDKL